MSERDWAYLLLWGATASGVWLARWRMPEYRPVAFYLCANLAASLVQSFFGSYGNIIERAMVLVDPISLAVVVSWVAARKTHFLRTSLVFWLMLTPLLEFVDDPRPVYLAVWCSSLFLCAVSFVAWGVERRRVRTPKPSVFPVGVLALVCAFEVLVLALGPWREGLYGKPYELAQLAYSVLFVTLIVAHGGALAWPQGN